MSIKGALFIFVFFFCAVAALILPHLGIYAYVADYCISPARQWWGRPFAEMGIRFSLILAMATFAGIILQQKKLQLGERLMVGQETTLLLFLILIWVTDLLTGNTVGRYTSVDHPSIKLTKIFIFCMMMTHLLTSVKKLNGLFWVLIASSFMLGVKAWETPYNQFMRGRLEGIGGADFAEANFFAAFMAAMLPIIGVQFLRSRLYGKALCLLSGAFTANAVILCRSRGAFLGLAIGVLAACLFAPEKHRKKVFALLLVGLFGVFYLSDIFFIERVMSITVDQGDMDTSSLSRLQLWKAGLRMFVDNPMGIGPGNWYQTIGNYLPDYAGKDAHSTFVKCAAELGIFGLTLFLLLLYQAGQNLRFVYKGVRVIKADDVDDFIHCYFASSMSLVVLLSCAVTITMIYTEIVWILLMLPICLRRAFENYVIEHDLKKELEAAMSGLDERGHEGHVTLPAIKKNAHRPDPV